MNDLYFRFRSVYPGVIKSWQSDNGSENLGEFEEQLKRDGIPHFFSYPNCPKINTYIERYNRTVQEEFIDNHLDIIHDKILFNKELADYLIFYNTQRVHKSLGNKTPIDYLIENGGMSQKSLTYTYTYARLKISLLLYFTYSGLLFWIFLVCLNPILSNEKAILQ
jgi:putative transposase